jgi:hypothetical protein
VAEPIDVETFYEQDQRRRNSEEEEFGDGWTSSDRPGATFQLAWIRDTGELYMMGEPLGTAIEDPFGDYEVLALARGSVKVEILAEVGESDLNRLLADWQQQMPRENSLDEVRRRLEEFKRALTQEETQATSTEETTLQTPPHLLK